jgi:hypothetical protein
MKGDVIGKCIIVLLFLFMGPGSAWAGPPVVNHQSGKRDSTRGSLIWMYQNTISRADGNRCPMYPSCSHYAAQAFAEKGPLIGWILACDRLLRGGRDETRLAPKILVNGVRLTYDPLSANTFWWDKK